MKFLFDIGRFSFIQIVVFGCLTMGGVYFFAYDDGKGLQKEISKLRKDITKAEKSLIKKKEEFADIQEFKRNIEGQKEVINSLLNYIPNQIAPIDVFTLLNNQAKATGVNIEDKKDKPSLEHEDYEILETSLKVRGVFTQILVFLSHLTGEKRMLVVDDLSIEKEKTSSTVSATFSVFAFKFKEKSSEEESQKEGQKSG